MKATLNLFTEVLKMQGTIPKPKLKDLTTCDTFAAETSGEYISRLQWRVITPAARSLNPEDNR